MSKINPTVLTAYVLSFIAMINSAYIPNYALMLLGLVLMMLLVQIYQVLVRIEEQTKPPKKEP